MRQDKMKGHMIRFKAKWINEGEKPSKYFCSLEKRNYLNKTIQRVELENGNICTERKDILDEVMKFYENLYKSRESELDDINLQHLLHTYNIRTLTNNQANKLEGDITENEILLQLKKMKNEKTPGCDGFPVELYKFFGKDLKSFLIRSFRHVYVNKVLPIDQRRSIITCLPKGNKPRQFLKNWRPISLLKVYYKIITGCIANRIIADLRHINI